MSPIVPGDAFILDAPTHVPPVWGDDGEVLWAQGEPLLLCGPPGVGKSTLIQQVVRARLGIGDLDVAGYMVTPDPDRIVLYLACDRPAQIARSMRRLFGPQHRTALEQGLVVWRGPLAASLVHEPGHLAELAIAQRAGMVILDSLKDLFAPLSSDEVGAAVKTALIGCTEAGIDICALHHQRKATGDNKRPIKLDDVYGSAWITAGAGSVVLLDGQAGDAVVRLHHLKQPADEVGPFNLIHDHATGTTTREDGITLAQHLVARGELTINDAATFLFGPSPDNNQRKKAQRKLDGLRIARKIGPDPQHPKATVRYVLAEASGIERDRQRDRTRPDPGPSRNGSNSDPAPIPDHPVPPSASAHTPLGGGAGCRAG